MIGIHKKRLAEWCNNNLDLLVIVTGITILFVANQLVNVLNTRWLDAGFWAFFIGTITVSVGVSALICYRILLRWHNSFI
jgi:hypothetical protein